MHLTTRLGAHNHGWVPPLYTGGDGYPSPTYVQTERFCACDRHHALPTCHLHTPSSHSRGSLVRNAACMQALRDCHPTGQHHQQPNRCATLAAHGLPCGDDPFKLAADLHCSLVRCFCTMRAHILLVVSPSTTKLPAAITHIMRCNLHYPVHHYLLHTTALWETYVHGWMLWPCMLPDTTCHPPATPCQYTMPCPCQQVWGWVIPVTSRCQPDTPHKQEQQPTAWGQAPHPQSSATGEMQPGSQQGQPTPPASCTSNLPIPCPVSVHVQCCTMSG